MCVVAFALDAHPRYRLVLAANRDEFHARASAPLARWDGADSHIVAGRDLVSGGTWLGVSQEGRTAVITNIRGDIPPDPAKTSRGELVADYLRRGQLPQMEDLDRYNAFSLLTISPDGAMLTANRPVPMAEPIASGIHGLSNGEPGAYWPRKDALLAAFAEYLTAAHHLSDTLFTLLASESIDDSIFIRNAVYGTRCSTVILVDADGRGTILERSFDTHGSQCGESKEAFHWPKPALT